MLSEKGYSGEYEFELDEGGCSYSARLVFGAEELIFPSEYQGKPVVCVFADEIGPANRQDVKSVFVPEGVLYLEGALFEAFSSLERITISASVQYISPECIIGCDKLYEIEVDPGNENFKTVDGHLYSKDGSTFLKAAPARIGNGFEIPHGVQKIGKSAFESCYKVSYFKLSQTVAEIGKNAFMACKSMREIYLPNSLKKICDLAFAYCESLNEIVIPLSAEQIGSNIFFNSNENLRVRCEAVAPGELWDEEWSDGIKHIEWGCV